MKSEDVESVLIPESLKSQLKVIGTFIAEAEGNRHLYNYASINYGQVIWLNLPLPLLWAP